MTVLLARHSVFEPQLIDGALELIDPVQAFVQQEFEPTDRARFIFYLAPQADNRRAQLIILPLQIIAGGGLPGHGPKISTTHVCGTSYL